MRKYSFTFARCPIEGCETPFPNYATQTQHFAKHSKWEEVQGSIALFDRKGVMQAINRRKA